MKKTGKKMIVWLLCVACLMIPISASSPACHWYCIRTKANRQPPIPPEYAFVKEYGGYFLDETHGDGVEDKVVYLTFDAGYENGNVAKTLNVLRKEGVSAAFFVLSHFVRANGDLIERMEREGHLVCNHTATHKDLSHASTETIESEIKALENVYREQTGKEMAKYFRPPEGSFSRSMLQSVYALGYKTVFWSFAYADWDNNKQPSAEKALRTVMDNMHNGAVILLHPTSSTNVEILPRVIGELKAMGYRFGTLDELCGVL